MLSTIGSIASQSKIKRFQDITVPTAWYYLKDGSGNRMFHPIIQAPSTVSLSVLYTNIYIENGFLYGTSSQNNTMVRLEPGNGNDGNQTYLYFEWYLEFTDGSEVVIANVSQSWGDVYNNGGVYLSVSAYKFPISVGNKVPYRFRMRYSGSGWDSSWGNQTLDQTVYFLFIKK